MHALHGAAALLACLLPVVFLGCATLPDWSTLRSLRAQKTVRVVDPQGTVTHRSTRALARRLHEEGQGDLLRRHLAVMEALGGPPLISGNQVRLLIDGPATYQAMFREISRARDHINLEIYILEDDELGQRLAELLMAKQSQGVQVNLIYDSVGSLGTSREFFQRLAQAGINVLEFNPLNPLKGKDWRLNNRDHRKILVVDGKVAFTGGINFSSVYSRGSSPSSGRGRPSPDNGWRDTQIEVRGPAVAEFQRLFLDTWHKQHGPPLARRNYFPELPQAGAKLLRVIGSQPGDSANLIYLELLSAISHAERSIRLTMAYFVPDQQTVAALCEAARRGVDVQLILPGFSDFWAVFHAGRSHYTTLLEAGVRIYERRDAMLHAKTAVVDGVWSTVGSANMDMRSFLHNDEVNVVVLGEEFAQQMQDMFDTDLGNAVPVDAAGWAARPLHLRLQEWLARMWEYWL